MTESDLTVLAAGTKERVAALVGRAVDGRGPIGPGPGPGATTRAGAGAGSGYGPRVAFACAEFNGGISDRLLTGALDALKNAGCDLGAVTVAWAPGAFELPLVAKVYAESGAIDAVICLGAVIRGDTGHYDFVAGQCAAGLQRVQLDTGTPVVFGVLTTDTVDQALVRSEDDEANKGREAAVTALEMIRLLGVLGRETVPEVGD
ncbi:MAG TPA: 6,7-dimethyl-8-ribityllumazine synthase [Acidimicrobiales bacterium]|jgi:6,7-dimethyl-8-ribityllumazine synthase|nr:6,7-dimethyl-8-ribityllumazine synthase [Acidimicrobiales bacterium]